VRIPLDYYRILGLPIQATAEQLKQSHRDRTLQVPRREYSELAVDVRRQLLDKAYEVLGDSISRAEYDQAFLAASKSAGESDPNDLEANVPTIDIENHQLVGALLILLELGEYELVLRLGRPYLKRDVHSLEGQQLKEQPALPDIILTLAVACLELGREEWQQNHYEHAAESLETGRELLLKEDLFPVLRAEVQADLYKLRPYRCLELIARPLEQQQMRQEGVNLLRGMLQDRGGIDGAEDDLSGLGVDDFLRFVQQLRGYLTAAEQQDVFEAEAQRPSAVGTYLAVYALLARGFAQHQPALIRRAKQMLLRLSGRQDVHLEQAVCAVLLGQTEEASRALELSQEYEPLAFIREHSQGSPDLLPGLCLYAENWLQQEVFPFFRDLDQELATLKDYFADSTVQGYLENLPLENERNNRQNWATQSAVTPAATPRFGQGSSADSAFQETLQNKGFVTAGNPFGRSAPLEGSAIADSQNLTTDYGSQPSSFGSMARTTGLAGAISAAGIAGANLAERISQLSPSGQLSSSAASSRPTALEGPDPGRGGRAARGASLRERRGRRSSPKWGRLALVILAGLSFVLLGLLLAKSVWSLIGGSAPKLKGEPLNVTINEPPIEIKKAEPAAAAAVPADDAKGIAEATINQWLATKKAAYAEAQDTSGLSTVLSGEPLSATQNDLESAKQEGWYIDYSHEPVKILSVEPEDATDADSLSVEAEVNESAEVYEKGQRSDQFSYADEVTTFSYKLVKENDKWLISDIQQ
jgi:ARC6-like, IMS domain/DnaJ domain